MKKLLITLAFLCLSSTAWSATHYFDNGAPDNNLPCTEGDPCDNFPGTTLDNTDALACGDHVVFKRGDEWTGSEAHVINSSTACSGNPITFGAYGTGADPILAGSAITSAGYSLHSGSIYKITQSQSDLNVVTEDDNKALMRWTGTNTTLPAGTWKRESSTLYLRLWDSGDPSTSSVRIGTYVQSFNFGLLRDSTTTADAAYHNYRDIKIIAVNGRAFTRHGIGGQDAGLTLIGCGYDCYLGWYRSTLGHAEQVESYYAEVAYGATSGSGYGQGITVYGSPFTFFVGTYSHDNGMSGMDFLDFSSDTNVTESGSIRSTITNNSLIPFDPSFDANLYSDGASEMFFYGNILAGGGGFLNNARSSFNAGSEHPTTKPAENISFVNNLVYGTHWTAITFDEICYSSVSECPPNGSTVPKKIKNINIINNTLLAIDSGSFEQVFGGVGELNTTADNIKFRNNIFVADNSGTVNNFHLSSSFFDFDNNVYYRRGGSTIIYKISNVDKTLAQWQSDSGEDANSIYTSTLPITTDSDTAPNAYLPGGSVAINAGMESPYTIPSWLPAQILTDIGSCGVRGSTVSGEFDLCSNLDIGYHKDYAGLTNLSITPTSSTKNTVTSYTIQFTMPKYVTALIDDWKIKFTFPAGYTLSSGAASDITSANISGDFSVVVSGQSITGTRIGPNNSSEFPGTYSFVVTNIKNPTNAGTTGVFYLETQTSAGVKIAEYYDHSGATNAIPGITISSGGASVCGNSIVEAGETCDDGGTTPGDGCSATCQTETPVCGNSIVEYLEQCDDGGTANGDGCDSNCQIENPVCGNGVLEFGEQCDDGGTISGDGCSATCQTESLNNKFTTSGRITTSGRVTVQ